MGASGNLDKMAAALAKYKEVKAELNAPPAKKAKEEVAPVKVCIYKRYTVYHILRLFSFSILYMI